MNNLSVKNLNDKKHIYKSMVNHIQGHYDFKCFLAKLFEYEDIMTRYIYALKKEIKLLSN